MRIYIKTKLQVVVHMSSFDGIQRSNYFGGEAIRRTERAVRVRKFKSTKATAKDDITEEMII